MDGRNSDISEPQWTADRSRRCNALWLSDRNVNSSWVPSLPPGFPKAHQRGSQAAHRVPLPACGRPEAWPWLRLFCNFYAFRSVCLLSQHLTTVFDKPRRGSILHHNTSRPAALRSSRPAARLPLIVTPMRLDTFSVYGGSGGKPKFVKKSSLQHGSLGRLSNFSMHQIPLNILRTFPSCEIQTSIGLEMHCMKPNCSSPNEGLRESVAAAEALRDAWRLEAIVLAFSKAQVALGFEQQQRFRIVHDFQPQGPLSRHPELILLLCAAAMSWEPFRRSEQILKTSIQAF